MPHASYPADSPKFAYVDFSNKDKLYIAMRAQRRTTALIQKLLGGNEVRRSKLQYGNLKGVKYSSLPMDIPEITNSTFPFE